MIVYRDKSNPLYKTDAKLFIKEAKQFSFKKILLHTDIYLAQELQADGIHLTSKDIINTPQAKALNLFTIVSTHSIKEAQQAQALGADMITFSPIFDTPNKGKPIGLEPLIELINIVNIPVIALGGIITPYHIKQCQEARAIGFASIRYFL